MSTATVRRALLCLSAASLAFAAFAVSLAIRGDSPDSNETSAFAPNPTTQRAALGTPDAREAFTADPTMRPTRPPTRRFVYLKDKMVNIPEGMTRVPQLGPTAPYTLEFGAGDDRSILIVNHFSTQALGADIKPEHRHLFEEIIAILGEPPPIPSQTPVVAKIGDQSIVLPDGFEYNNVGSLGDPRSRWWLIRYSEHGVGVSVVHFEDAGELIDYEVIPEHQELFEPILALFRQPLPEPTNP